MSQRSPVRRLQFWLVHLCPIAKYVTIPPPANSTEPRGRRFYSLTTGTDRKSKALLRYIHRGRFSEQLPPIKTPRSVSAHYLTHSAITAKSSGVVTFKFRQEPINTVTR